LKSKNYTTNSDYKVDRGATEGDAEACSLQAAQADRPSNDGIRSKRNWYNKGQSLIEYLIIVGIVAIGSISIVSILGGNINRKMANINAGLIGGATSEKKGESIKEKALRNRDLGNFLNGAVEHKKNSDSNGNE